MQIFELHFNPKGKEDKFFDSFIYEPENIQEKRQGNLYMVGELAKALPQNAQFLNNLALVIKKEAYRTDFQESLKKANEFLEAESKKGNVSWLGNLNFAVLNFKNFILNFTKVGGVKILLQRGEELLDIGQNLEFQDQEPYPLKVFGSIASGKLTQGDKVLILTDELFSAENILNQIVKVSDEKELKEVLKTNKKQLSELSGVCLLLIMTETVEPKQSVTFRREAPEFKFPKPKFPKLKFSKPKLPKLKLPKIKLPSLKMLPSPGLPKKLPSPKLRFALPKVPRLYKSIVIIIVLILVLAAASFIFRSEKEEEVEKSQEIINEAQSKIFMAENFLILKDEEKAKILFQEAWDTLQPLLEQKGAPLQKEARVLQKTIEEYLK